MSSQSTSPGLSQIPSTHFQHLLAGLPFSPEAQAQAVVWLSIWNKGEGSGQLYELWAVSTPSRVCTSVPELADLQRQKARSPLLVLDLPGVGRSLLPSLLPSFRLCALLES